MNYRIEKDTMGEVKVPQDALYGAQTQRSIDNFKIAQDINRMPKEVIRAFAYLKKAAAITNMEAGVLSKEKNDLISAVSDEIIAGKLDEYFPLVVWQTGSGTQSNMNVNEVIAYRAHVLNGGKLSDKEKVLHPNDDVNKSQSSNDTFPTAMHIAAYKILIESTIPGIEKLRDTLREKSSAVHECGKDRADTLYGRYPSNGRTGIKRLCISVRSWVKGDQKYVISFIRARTRRHSRGYGHQYTGWIRGECGQTYRQSYGPSVCHCRKQVRSARLSRCDCRDAWRP